MNSFKLYVHVGRRLYICWCVIIIDLRYCLTEHFIIQWKIVISKIKINYRIEIDMWFPKRIMENSDYISWIKYMYLGTYCYFFGSNIKNCIIIKLFQLKLFYYEISTLWKNAIISNNYSICHILINKN